MTDKAFLIRLSDEEREALREQAELEHRSMQDVARLAVLGRVEARRRSADVRSSLERIMARDSELLDRLSK